MIRYRLRLYSTFRPETVIRHRWASVVASSGMRVAFIVAVALVLFGCDRVRWHRYILPDPYPDTVHAQYSNPGCDAFPIVDGEVVIEYDGRGCACTSEPLRGQKSRPATAYSQRTADGTSVPLPNFQIDWAHGWAYDDNDTLYIAVATQNIRLEDGLIRSDLLPFLDQCAHLPGVDELRRNEEFMRDARLFESLDPD